MEIRVLGPIQVLVDGKNVKIDGPRSLALLSGLVAGAGTLLSIDFLIECGWDADPPRTVRRQVSNRTTALNRTLKAAGFAGNLISNEGNGFVLQLADTRIDLKEFEYLADEGKRLAAVDPSAAVQSFRAALAEWRGPAFAGLDAPRLRLAAAHLDEKRSAVLQRCIAIELRLGQHRELVSELTHLVGIYPTHEVFAAHLMLALFHSGRQSDALCVYATTRRRLIEEIGVYPGAELQRLHKQILCRDLDRIGLLTEDRPGSNSLILPWDGQ